MSASSGVFSASKVAIVLAVLCSLYLFRDIWLPSTPAVTLAVPPRIPESAFNHSSRPQDVDCINAPGADRVMIVVKTGASEVYEKLPTHLITLFRCTPHYLIFSDLAQNFSDYNIYDALETVGDEYKEGNDDFEVYRKLQQYQREGLNVAKLKGNKGWNLDKWKFLPMMREAHRMAPPEVDWFVYMEADTSLSWTNLLQFLAKMDPKKPLYLGAQNVIGYTTFAHGGSGYIVSRAAAEKVEKKRQKTGVEKYDARWEVLTAMNCCGDVIVARVLEEAGVPLTPSWPRIQGETVSTLDWTKEHWCAPAVTWHHVSAAQVDSMWHFQAQWVKDHGWSTPYLFRDVFDEFVMKHISQNRTAWNNLSQDKTIAKPTPDSEQDFAKRPSVEQKSVESFEGCAAACRSTSECIQYMYEPGLCKMGKAIRLGDGDEREGEKWKSGWLLDRIQGMRQDLQSCKPNWVD